MMSAYVKFGFFFAACAIVPAILLYAFVPANAEFAWKAIGAGAWVLYGVSMAVVAFGALARRRPERDPAKV